jgi:small subunit ribosomal protein S4
MRRRKPSIYAEQLTEKQKVRATYGLGERQLRTLFEEASRLEGPHGENALLLLERRLDNVVYRLGWARSRPMARQLVSHGHVRVDGERVTVPSYRVEPGMVVELSADVARSPVVAGELGAGRPLPAWLERTTERTDATAGQPLRGRVTRVPARADVDAPVDESLVVAFYAR